jgi:hypothetical protein
LDKNACSVSDNPADLAVDRQQEIYRKTEEKGKSEEPEKPLVDCFPTL